MITSETKWTHTRTCGMYETNEEQHYMLSHSVLLCPRKNFFGLVFHRFANFVSIENIEKDNNGLLGYLFYL